MRLFPDFTFRQINPLVMNSTNKWLLQNIFSKSPFVLSPNNQFFAEKSLHLSNKFHSLYKKHYNEQPRRNTKPDFKNT